MSPAASGGGAAGSPAMASATDTARLIVGLGNSGERYAATRHNVGFWLVDRLAEREGLHWRSERRYRALMARWDRAGTTRWLMKPEGFMNDSGSAVAACMRYLRLPAPSLLVAHDDLDLPPGAVRLKRGGGEGGHRGLADITRKLGSRDYLRLRIGIGHPGVRELVTPWVLGRPAPEEREAIGRAIDDALAALPQVLDGDVDAAMRELHRPRPGAPA